jgi:hypothetical protein
MTKLATEITTRTFKVKLNYNTPVHEKEESLSHSNRYITAENFPETATGEREEEAVLVNFGEDIESEKALVHLQEMGLRPGSPSELVDLHLSNRAPNPELEECFPIAALGTVWTDPYNSRRVACLGGDAHNRDLHLGWFDGGSYDDCWFLAFRESS